MIFSYVLVLFRQDYFVGRTIFSCAWFCDSAAVGNWLLYSTAMERSGMAMIGDRMIFLMFRMI
jgi:hypothetical protein